MKHIIAIIIHWLLQSLSCLGNLSLSHASYMTLHVWRIDSNRRKTYSLASKTSSEFRDKHYCADNYFPELVQRTKLCGNDKRAFIIKR